MSKYTTLDDDLHAYMLSVGVRQDEVLERVQAETAAMGSISAMQIAPDQGAFMEILTRSLGVTEALEVGTFPGYSAISIARGLAPAGHLICLEVSEEYAETASRNLEAAGVADRVEIIVGAAAETIRMLPEREHFGLVFIDADKTGYDVYFEEALRRTCPGGLILLDNMLQDGRVLDPAPDDDTAIERQLYPFLYDMDQATAAQATATAASTRLRPAPTPCRPWAASRCSTT